MASSSEKAAAILILRRTWRITSSHPVTTRQITQRTCVACRKIKAKGELVRLVRTPEGNIEIDCRGKKAGRGAYLCPERECWEKALKGNQLEHSLRSRLTQDNREQLIKRGKELLEGVK